MRAKEIYWGARARVRARRVAVTRSLRPILIPWQQRRNGGVFAIEICARIGLFAQVNMSLRIASYCAAQGLRPYVRMTGAFYARTEAEDYFGAYFENAALTSADLERIVDGRIRVSCIDEIQDLGLPRQVFEDLTLERANELMTRYMPPQAWLLREVDDFVEANFGSGLVLGLHYRGTDKSSEAEPVPHAVAIDAVNQLLKVRPSIATVFVASDEQRFVDAAVAGIGHARVVVHADSKRSLDGKAIHTGSSVGDRRLVQDAMMNCLLLSRCDLLLRTSSFLSAWASVFNPRLPVILLNRPRAETHWFPDSEILKQAATVSAHLGDSGHEPEMERY